MDEIDNIIRKVIPYYSKKNFAGKYIHNPSAEYKLTYDPMPAKRRFEELSKLPPEKVDIKEVSDDIEAGRLLIAMDYKEMRNTQLKEQLKTLKNWLEMA